MFACSVSGIGVGLRTKGTNSFELSVYETDTMNVLQALSCPVQLFLHLSGRSGERTEPHTSSSLLTAFFLMYSMMVPCVIHSETVVNSLFSMSP